MFAELIAFHLDALNRLDASETDLGRERQTAELREQFIAVLGHDLRSPLAAIASGSRLLKREDLSAQGLQIVQTMHGATSRMASLIENLLDFAKARLGGGLAIVTVSQPIEPVLAQVVDELRAGHPDRLIDVEFDLAKPMMLDGQRIGQLASNLIGNALAYGDADKAIHVRGITNDKGFELSVTNSGPAITPESLEKLFLPFVRGANNSGKKGLGLGLYIASEIARAHGGDLTAASANGETRFTFRVPLRRYARKETHSQPSK